MSQDQLKVNIMLDNLADYQLFLYGGIAIIATLLFVRIGSPKQIIDWAKNTAEGKNAKVGILAVLAVFLLVTLFAFCTRAEAQEKIEWLPFAYVEFGIDTPINPDKFSIQCAGKSSRDKDASNIFGVLGVARKRRWEGVVYYNHQSGAVCKDRSGATEDTVGVAVRIYAWR